MRIRRVGHGVKGFLKEADRGLYWDMICPNAEERFKVLRFWERHGLLATQEAFGVSRRTLYAWRARRREGKGAVHRLAPGSTRPLRLRQRRWPAPMIAYLRQMREQRGNLGKEKLHGFVRRFCEQRALKVPSVRTIGRLIADAPDKMRFVPRRPSRFYQGCVQRRTRDRKPKGYRPEQPGDCLAWDSIERRLAGGRRYLITSTDLSSRFGFALATRGLSSTYAELAWRLQQELFPVPTRRALSDNGQEFGKHFAQALKARHITHWHTYPRTPKMNAHCERFNRTLQEEFVDYHEDLLFADLPAFNERLFEWLGWYNLERPHHALALQTPVQVISAFIQQPCRMYWPSTFA